MKSSWFSPVSTTSVIVCALFCALSAAPAARAADPPAADSTAAPAPAPSAAAPTPAAAAPAAAPVDRKAAKKAQRDAARKERGEAKAKKEADKRARQEAEDKLDRDASSPWIRDANWMSFRAGTASSAVKNSPDGNVGVGFGMYHFLNHRWAAALQADLDVLGKFSGATEMELPLTLEMTRHFRWKTPTMRPYVGAGTGVWFHRYYRTGDDQADVRPGIYLSGGINTPIAPRSLLGVDMRLTFQGNAESDNPLFPNQDTNALHWSFKLNYLRWI